MEIFSKNPVYLKEYANLDSNFRLLEAKQDWIVFRTQPSSYIRKGESKPRPTIDLILVGAKFIELPVCLYGLNVSRPKDELSRVYAEKYDKGSDLPENDERVYAIKSEGSRFHVVTSNLWIHIHKERISELPIDYFFYSDIKKYNYYLDNYVENWIKIK